MNLRKVQRFPASLFQIQLAVIVCFLLIGMSLGSLPLAITLDFHLDNTAVGLIIGLQFLASICSRLFVGEVIRNYGVRRSVIYGLAGLSLYGLSLLFAGLLDNLAIAVIFLALARVILGFAEGVLITAAVVWSNEIVGVDGTGRILSITGMSIYGSVACGAPLGILLYNECGLIIVAIPMVLLPLIIALVQPITNQGAFKVHEKASSKTVFQHVFPFGSVLFLHAVGFVSIDAFISLYFIEAGWEHVSLALFTFGVAFVVIRIFFGWTLGTNRLLAVGLVSIALEGLSLALISLASNQYWALLFVALAGASCSLTFPALGALAMKCCKEHERGVAMGFYSAFQDMSYGVTGPLVGMIIGHSGYRSGFLAASIAAFLGFIFLVISRTKLNRITDSA